MGGTETPAVAAGSAAAAAPSSAPATGASPTPTPSPTPSTSTAAPEMKEGQSTQDFLREGLEKAAAELPKEEEPKPAEEIPAPEPEAKPEPQDVKPEDAKPEDKPADKPEDKPAAEPNPLDKLGPLPVEKIASAIAANPELDAALKKAGISTEVLTQTARMAAETEQYKQEVGSLETAKVIKESAGHFHNIEEKFPAIKSVEDFDSFVTNVMVPLSAVYDPETGEPKVDAQGRLVTDGSVSRFLKLGTDVDLAWVAKFAAEKGGEEGEELLAALDIVNNFRNNGYKFGKASGAELTEEQKAAQAKIDLDRKALDDQAASNRQQQEKVYYDEATSDTIKGLEPLISGTLEPLKHLPQEIRDKMRNDILTELAKTMEANSAFMYQRNRIRAMGMNDKAFKEYVSLNLREMPLAYAAVAQKVLNSYGAAAIAANKTQRETIATQTEKDRKHAATGTSTQVSSPTNMTNDQIQAQAEDEILKENGGKKPADFQSQLIGRIMRIQAKQNKLFA